VLRKLNEQPGGKPPELPKDPQVEEKTFDPKGKVPLPPGPLPKG
jgi:hypothetical protein